MTKWRGALILAVGFALGLGTAHGAGDLLARLQAADDQYKAGEQGAAFGTYRSLLQEALEADELTEGDRFAAAGAAVSLAMGTFGDLAANATDETIKHSSANMADGCTSLVGARFVKAVSHGARVDINEHLTPGRTTIVDFTSIYCPPCEAIRPKLERMAIAWADKVAILKVDINRPDVRGIDWESPVAQQYGLRSIPHFKIFDAEGKLIAEGDRAYGMVQQYIQQMEQ